MNFKDFIDIEEHKNEINRDVQNIRNEYSRRLNSAREYLGKLADYFLSDIVGLTNLIYENITLAKQLDKVEFTLKELHSCLNEGGRYFFDEYNKHICNYDMGSMIGESRHFSDDKALFENKANRILKKQCDLLYSNYRKQLKNERYNYWTFILVLIAAITGMILVVLEIIPVIHVGFNFLQKL